MGRGRGGGERNSESSWYLADLRLRGIGSVQFGTKCRHLNVCLYFMDSFSDTSPTTPPNATTGNIVHLILTANTVQVCFSTHPGTYAFVLHSICVTLSCVPFFSVCSRVF